MVMTEKLVEVEQLVKQLYQTSIPGDVDRIQKQLQDLQRASGWHLAEGLLRSEDQNVRFFAALTFTVKINQDGPSLGDDDLQSLLTTLLNWLVLLVRQNEGALVLRKLCSTLVTYFVLPNSAWKLCIRHILCCLHAGCAIAENTLADYPDTPALLANLPPKQCAMVITFIRNLAEDATRIEHTSQNMYCHERVELNLDDAIAIMSHAFARVDVQQGDFQRDVLQCYQSWIIYARQEYSASSAQLQHLRDVFATAVQCLFIDDVFEAAAEMFTDLFSADDGFLKVEDQIKFAQLLDTQWAMDYLARLERDDADGDANLFGQLVAAFAHSISGGICREPSTFYQVFEMMHRITRTQRFDTVDQALSNAIVDFWEFLISNVDDYTPDNKNNVEILEAMKMHWLSAVHDLCVATALPLDPVGELQRLGADHSFTEFRARVQDAVQSSYNTFDAAVLHHLVSLALEVYSAPSIPDRWGNLEAIFNCICGIAESMEYQGNNRQVADKALQTLFSSQMYHDLTDLSSSAPTRLRKASLIIIGEHHEFLGRQPGFLLNALEILFVSLQETPVAETASRSIFALCGPNRTLLGTKIVPLLDASKHFFSSPSSTPTSKENIVAAIGSITQALPSGEVKIQVFGQLLSLVEQEYQRQLERTSESGANKDEIHRAIRLSALAQLIAIGRASQTPDDVPIDLDADEDAPDGQWNPAQTRIVNLLRVLVNDSLGDGSFLEGACDVLQAGYPETRAGPFVFDPTVTVQLVSATHRNTPRLDVALRTASAFISSNSSKPIKAEATIAAILQWVCSIVDDDLAQRDPEVAHACLDLLNRLIPRHLGLIAQLPSTAAQSLFNLSIQCLASAELFPKRSAANFWTSIFGATSNSMQSYVQGLIETYGAVVVAILIGGFAGNASRSQLDWLSEPYRKLISKHARSPWKLWTKQALFDPGFPSQRVTKTEKDRFVAQVERLRGERKTTLVAKEFWLACRGTPVGYG